MNAQLLFLVGCPRSGTTWLQLLLAQHPAIATGQETHLFSQYLGAMERRFEQHAALAVPIGLPATTPAGEFDALCRTFSDRVFDTIVGDKPGATVLLEKTPDHVLNAAWIARLYPAAKFLHLVRDPRAVVASLLEMHRSQPWAPGNAIEAARLWERSVEAGRDFAGRSGQAREIRYEDLHRDPVGELRGLFSWLGLEADDSLCRAAVEHCSIDGMKRRPQAVEGPESVLRDLDNVVRRGEIEGWRDELSASQVRAVEYVSRDLMEHYGYSRSVPGNRRPLRVAAHDATERVRGAVAHALDRVASRL